MAGRPGSKCRGNGAVFPGACPIFLTQHQGMLYETGLPSRQLCLPRSLGRGDATGGGDRRRPHYSGACVRQERALFVPRDLLLPDFPGKACHSGRMLGRRWPAAPVAAGDGPQHADGESRRYVRSLPGVPSKKYRGTAKRQLLCGAPFCTMCLNARLRPYAALCRVIGPSQGRRALAFQDPRERQ